MSLEVIIFIASILLGIVIYWRESRGNKIYRFLNKLINSEELQMKDTDAKGFVYQQNLILRLVFISTFFLVLILIAQFLMTINFAAILLFASMIFGTLIGTYIANAIFKTSEIIEEQTDSIEEKLNEVIEKGKDFIDDFKEKEDREIEITKVAENSTRAPLKDKELL